MIASFSRCANHMLAAVALVLLLTNGAGAVPNQTYVSAPDGVKVAVQEYGIQRGRKSCWCMGWTGVIWTG